LEGVFEKATKEDLAQILELQKKAFEPVAIAENNFNIQPMTQTLESIIEEFDKRVFYKYVLEGTIVGSVRSHLDENNTCHVGKLIVHPDFQNCGIGQGLIKIIEKAFSNCNRYEIFTSINAKKTVSLYKKIGYKEINVKNVNGMPIVFLDKENT